MRWFISSMLKPISSDSFPSSLSLIYIFAETSASSWGSFWHSYHNGSSLLLTCTDPCDFGSGTCGCCMWERFQILSQSRWEIHQNWGIGLPFCVWNLQIGRSYYSSRLLTEIIHAECDSYRISTLVQFCLSFLNINFDFNLNSNFQYIQTKCHVPVFRPSSVIALQWNLTPGSWRRSLNFLWDSSGSEARSVSDISWYLSSNSCSRPSSRFLWQCMAVIVLAFKNAIQWPRDSQTHF